MLYIDLPPETDSRSEPIPPGKREMTPKQRWRRETVLKNLTDPIIVGETAKLLQDQEQDIRWAFQPRNGWQDWLTSTIATIMLRLNRCERIERKLRDWASYRAIDFWEDDQRLAVETLALKIGREPARVVNTLRETPAGIDWLMGRWAALARAEPADWTDARLELASCLLGGEAVGQPLAPDVIQAKLAELEARRERIDQADALARGLVEADLNDSAVPDLAKLRRYVRSLHRQMKWYIDQFHVDHADRWDDPRRRPAIDGPPREQYRPSNPNRFEGKDEPAWTTPAPTEVAPPPSTTEASQPDDETKPSPAEVCPATAETKPFPVEERTEGDETNPSWPVRPVAPPSPTAHCHATETGRHHSRPLGAGEHSREYARRLRAARRRTNLALVELS